MSNELAKQTKISKANLSKKVLTVIKVN